MNSISVIMSVYNEELRWLDKAIQSILNQSFKAFEFIIVVDNPDNEVIVNYLSSLSDNRIKILKNEKNLGLVNSLNKALKFSKGKYIIRMDADDISDKFRIEKQFNYMENHKEIALLGSGVDYIDENDKIINKFSKVIVEPNDIKNRLKYGNCVNHPTWIFRSNIIKSEKIEGYREVPCAEDLDLLCRLSSNGFKIANINESLLKYRLRSNGISLSNKFEQEAIKQYVIGMYKDRLNNKEDKFNSGDIKKILNNEYEKIRYKKSLEIIKNKANAINKIKATFISKYYRKKCINNLIWKIRYSRSIK